MDQMALRKIAPPAALHRAENDLPFVTFFEGLDFQLLQASVENGLWVVRTRFQPKTMRRRPKRRWRDCRRRSGQRSSRCCRSAPRLVGHSCLGRSPQIPKTWVVCLPTCIGRRARFGTSSARQAPNSPSRVAPAPS